MQIFLEKGVDLFKVDGEMAVQENKSFPLLKIFLFFS